MQIQTCSQPGFTLPDISRYRRWAFTPPLHLYCTNSNIFSVALSSPSRVLGFPKQACYFDCPDFPHNLCPRSRSTCAVALRLARLGSGTVTGCSLKLPLHRHALHTPLPSLSLNVCSRTTSRSARVAQLSADFFNYFTITKILPKLLMYLFWNYPQMLRQNSPHRKLSQLKI